MTLKIDAKFDLFFQKLHEEFGKYSQAEINKQQI